MLVAATVVGWVVFGVILILGIAYGAAQLQRDRDLHEIRKNTDEARKRSEERDD